MDTSGGLSGSGWVHELGIQSNDTAEDVEDPQRMASVGLGAQRRLVDFPKEQKEARDRIAVVQNEEEEPGKDGPPGELPCVHGRGAVQQ